MFNALFKKAQQSVDNALSEIASKALVAVPFVVAGGFAVAALVVRLHRTYDVEAANLILASGFAALGVVVALLEAVRQQSRRRAAAAASVVPESQDAAPSQAEDKPNFGDADREVVMAALSSAAPLAIPYVMRTAFKNLPIIALVAAIGFVMSRDGQPGDPHAQPAE